jgi:putative phosphoesterase
MTKVGLLSDTHGYWDEKYLQYFEPCDEIWHAGDIGTLEVAQKLAAFRPFRAVYGNIDGQEIRQLYPQILRFTVDGAEVLMKHIGGYPGNYDPSIKGSILVRPPKLFISGHSHILKVKYDKTLDVLHINPGAAGIQGFHKVRTMVFGSSCRKTRHLRLQAGRERLFFLLNIIGWQLPHPLYLCWEPLRPLSGISLRKRR